ncbi:MAG: hypothetical protein VW552_05485, partial [Ilumatobacter sp.]
NMAADPDDLNPRHCIGFSVKRRRIGCRHPELVLSKTRGDIRVSVGIHIGVDPNTDWRFVAKGEGNRIHPFKFFPGLNTQDPDAGRQGLCDFIARLADA